MFRSREFTLPHNTLPLSQSSTEEIDMTWLLLLIGVSLLAYLAVAMFAPEKF
ncbi:potassium-transporting ATPase subunit F [Idiomarina loihiensis]|uniref:potassium-transporting ATPase subunit F n=1 Tax=Idiomarina loihiensis TaxID=135577 RepID=UPI000D70F913